MSNNLGLNPFPDLICHFLAPWWPFWVSRLLIGQNPECSDQKTYLAKVTRNAQLDPFPDLSPRRSARIKKLAAPGALAHRLQRRTACNTSPPALSKMAKCEKYD